MEMKPIGVVRSCFPEKFGTPRQPGLVPAATAELWLDPPFDHPDSLRGLEDCSHVWILFVFHGNRNNEWRSTVRPPRLGGNRRMGVFATRSPYRPNPIGMSVVALDGIFSEPEGRGLRLRNHDLVDGTPVLDVKPYLSYSDAVPDARSPTGFDRAPETLPVRFTAEARAQLSGAPPNLENLIRQTLGLDPRPAYRRAEEGTVHGVSVAGYNVRWCVVEESLVVLGLARL